MVKFGISCLTCLKRLRDGFRIAQDGFLETTLVQLEPKLAPSCLEMGSSCSKLGPLWSPNEGPGGSKTDFWRHKTPVGFARSRFLPSSSLLGAPKPSFRPRLPSSNGRRYGWGVAVFEAIVELCDRVAVLGFLRSLSWLCLLSLLCLYS